MAKEGTTTVAASQPPTEEETKALVKQADDFKLSTELTICLQETLTDLDVLKAGKGALVIRKPEVEVEARRLFNNYKEYIARIDEERTAAKEPILKAGRIIDARAKVHSSAAEVAKNFLEASLKEFVAWQDAEARRIQDELNAKHEKDVAREQKRADKKGEEPRPVAPAPVVQTPQKSTVVQVGDKAVTQVWVDNWKWRIPGVPDPSGITADKAATYGIPLSYFVLDCKKIDGLTKNNKSTEVIPGSKVEGYNDRYLR